MAYALTADADWSVSWRGEQRIRNRVETSRRWLQQIFREEPEGSFGLPPSIYIRGSEVELKTSDAPPKNVLLMSKYLPTSEHLQRIKEALGGSYPRAIARLELLHHLMPDWDSYGGEPPTEDTINHAIFALDALKETAASMGKTLPEPDVCPGSDGTIQFEWKADGKGFQLEVIVSAGEPKYSYLSFSEDESSEWEEGGIAPPVAEHHAVIAFMSQL